MSMPFREILCKVIAQVLSPPLLFHPWAIPPQSTSLRNCLLAQNQEELSSGHECHLFLNTALGLFLI